MIGYARPFFTVNTSSRRMNVPSANAPALVLHADDFGMNAAVNSGILRTFREGILTSTSLLANAPFAADACAAWPQLIENLCAGSLPSTERRRQLGDLLLPFDIGIHLNLTQGRPLSGESYPSVLLNDQGQFPGIQTVFRRLRITGTNLRDAVQAELRLQIEWMIDHGIRPTHLNGHQYIELFPGVAELVPGLLERYSIPVVRLAREPRLASTVLKTGRLLSFGLGIVKHHFARKFHRRIAATSFVFPERYFGTSHAGRVDLRTLHRFTKYASRNGCTEIGLHPGDIAADNIHPVADGWGDLLGSIRPQEASWLCGETAPEMLATHGLRLGRLSELKRCPTT